MTLKGGGQANQSPTSYLGCTAKAESSSSVVLVLRTSLMNHVELQMELAQSNVIGSVPFSVEVAYKVAGVSFVSMPRLPLTFVRPRFSLFEM